MDLKYDYIDYDGRVFHSFVVKSNHTPYKKSTDSEYKYEPYYDKKALYNELCKRSTSNKSTGMDIWTKRLLNIAGVISASLFIYLTSNIVTICFQLIYPFIIEAFESMDSIILLHIYMMSVMYFIALFGGWMFHDCVTKYVKIIPPRVEKIIFYLTRIPIINVYIIFVYLAILVCEYIRIEIVPLFKNK